MDQTEAACGACGRFVGPLRTCPFCSAAVAVRPALRILRYAALILSAGGLLMVFFMVSFCGVARVDIGEITLPMNYAWVRVEGIVERSPYVSDHNDTVDYLSFSLHDGTGTLRVCARGAVATGLAASGIPRKGQTIACCGRVEVYAGGRVRLVLVSDKNVQVKDGASPSDVAAHGRVGM